MRIKDRLVRVARALTLLACVAFAAPATFALDTGDIVVVSTHGELRVTMKGSVRAVRAGSVLELPASVRTGRDGGIELRQGATTVNVGPDTQLDFPALDQPGGPIDRIQQPRGNAFYDIGKREGRRLRVETPYLVGVVKGTQFNVSARDDATTISLFEGLLEVRATDESSVVDLKAGEIASRRRGDKTISVIRMDAGKLPPPATRSDDRSSGGTPVAPGPVDPGRAPASLVDGEGAGRVAPIDLPVGVAAGLSPDSGASASGSLAGSGSAVDISTRVDVGPAVANIGASTGIDVSAGAIATDVAVSVGVDAGAVNAALTTSTGLDVSTSGLALDQAATVDLAAAAPLSVDTGATLGIDVGTGGAAVDIDAGAGLAAGQQPVTVVVDTSTSIDVGASGLGADLTTGAAVDAGPIVADIGAGAALDTGGIAAVDTGASLGVVSTPVDVTAGVSAAVDAGAGTIDLGLSIGDTSLGLGIDLGLDGNDPGATDTGSPATSPTDTGNTGTIDVGGLLESLLRRPGRR